MDPKKLLKADYLDIIYDQRNKNYGGYELRRHYNRRLRNAAVFAITGVAAILSFSFITSNRAHDIHVPSRDSTIRIADIHPAIQPPRVPKPFLPPPSLPKQQATQRLTVPKIEPDEHVAPYEQMTENKNLANVQPGPENHDGDSVGLSQGSINSPGTGLGESLAAKSAEPVRYVQQMPQFIGDMNTYLTSKTRYPESARINGIEGMVIVEFVVNENGVVSNSKVVRSVGGGCDEEALRVINSMPKWKPGKQNGIAVKVFFTLPIRFQLSN